MIYKLLEDGASLMSNYTREVFVKYIIRGARYYATENEDKPIEYILPGDIIDTERIERTGHVKRLPDSYSQETQDLLPFDISKTKPNRKPLNGYQEVFHIQDTVQFYEAIEYIPIETCHLPEPAYTLIHHVRDLSKPVRRKVFSDLRLHKKKCTHPFVYINGVKYLDHWVDQYKRDLNKYKDTKGILLIPATPEDIRDNYWNSLAGLTKVKGIPDDDIGTRIIEHSFMNLRCRYDSDLQDFYLHTTHKAVLRPYEREIPV